MKFEEYRDRKATRVSKETRVTEVSRETKEILDFVVKKVKEVRQVRKENAASMDNSALRENLEKTARMEKLGHAVSEVNKAYPDLLGRMD